MVSLSCRIQKAEDQLDIILLLFFHCLMLLFRNSNNAEAYNHKAVILV